MNAIYVNAIMHEGAAHAYHSGVERALGQAVPRFDLHGGGTRPWDALLEEIGRAQITHVLLSGSELNTTDGNDTRVRTYLRNLPRLVDWIAARPQERHLYGICFAHQAMALVMGGSTVRAGRREGIATVRDVRSGESFRVPVVHSDQVGSVPACMRLRFESDYCPVQGLLHSTLPIETVQFHPEVNEVVKDVEGEKDDWVGVGSEDLATHAGPALLRQWFSCA
jgi:GMP synthase-like glutamine amidotransferase